MEKILAHNETTAPMNASKKIAPDTAQKNKLANTDASKKTDQIFQVQDTTHSEITQQLANLPTEKAALISNRIAEAQKFFNLIFGSVHETKFSYLWVKRDNDKATVAFDVSTAENRRQMAHRAIELSNEGFDVYFGVNLQDKPSAENERGTEDTITAQTAVVCDIDTLGGKHTDPDKYPPTFDAAKSFLPFNLSLLVNSGYGLHGYYIHAAPLAVTDDNRAEVKARNGKFIETIRIKAGKFSKAVDSVGDLPRVLRVPGTRNYKLGVSDDAPICRLVEVNPVRFVPTDLDTILNAFISEHEKILPAPKTAKKMEKPARQSKNFADSPDYDSFRANLMLDAIPVKDLSGTEWLAAISALKNLGFTYEQVDALNQGGQHYNETENHARWDSLNNTSFDIETLHGIAKRFGYEERDARRQWYDLHPELRPSTKRNISDETKRELDDAVIWLDTLDPENFSANDARGIESIHKVALAAAFGFSSSVENFFKIIKDAKKNAKIRLADANSNLTEPLSDQEKKSLQDLIDLNINRLSYLIKFQVDTIKKAHADFLQQEHKRKLEFAKAKRKEEVAQNLSSLEDLIKTYREKPTRELANKIREIVFNACEPRFDRSGIFLGIKATAANAKIIFSYDPVIDGLIGYDEFKQADVFLKVAPWKYEHGTPLDEQPCIRQEWRDSDDAELRKYLRETYTEFAGKQLISDYTISYSNKNRFHVVKEFFKNLPLWDGQPRAETLFIKFLRVEDSPFAREVTLNWLTAAVARIFNPGCRYQTALVLHGAQGIGKGFTLEKLGGEWYGALVDNVDDPHAIDTIKSLWIVEIPEMSAMRKAEVNAIKSFISRSEDTRRFAYERRAARVQRHCVFAITVNDDQFLIDPTGNRRYLILHCNSARLDYVEGLTDDYINQVWAEVYFKYNKIFKDGFDEKKLELSKTAQIHAEEIASHYMKDDGLQGEIKAFVDTKIPPLPIWNLLSREERRKFFAQGFITLLDGQADLNKRARGRFGRNAQKYVDELDKIFRRQDTVIRKNSVKRGGDTLEEFHIYGSEYRQHICAAEIFTECFGQDNRKKIHRVHEVLAELDGWTQGDRIPRDMAYGNQTKVFYRDTEKESNE